MKIDTTSQSWNKIRFGILPFILVWMIGCFGVKRNKLDTSKPSGFFLNATILQILGLAGGGTNKPANWPIYSLSRSFSTSAGNIFLGNALSQTVPADVLLLTSDGISFGMIPIIQPSGNQYRIDLAGAYDSGGTTYIVLAFLSQGTGTNYVQRVAVAPYSSGSTTQLKTDDTTVFKDIPFTYTNNYTAIHYIGAVGSTAFIQGDRSGATDTFYSTDNFSTIISPGTPPTNPCPDFFVINNYLVCGGFFTNTTIFTGISVATPSTPYNANLGFSFGDSANYFVPGIDSSGNLEVGQATASAFSGSSFISNSLTTSTSNPNWLTGVSSLERIAYFQISASAYFAGLQYKDTSATQVTQYLASASASGTWMAPNTISISGSTTNYLPTGFVTSGTLHLLFLDSTQSTHPIYSVTTTDGATFSSPTQITFPYNGP